MFHVIAVLCLFLQIPDGLQRVTVFQGNIVVDPENAVMKRFKFAPGDWISVEAEAVKQELVQTGKEGSLESALGLLSQALSKSDLKVSSIEISEIEGEVLAQSGDAQKVELAHLTTAGGSYAIVVKNNDAGCRKTYSVRIVRASAHDSLVAFDTRLKPTRIDTITAPVIDKSLYLSAGEKSVENFKISGEFGRFVVIVSNEESHNALTSEVGSSMISLVTNMAFGLPLPFDLSAIKAGKDFGYRIDYFDPVTQKWQSLNPITKTVFENRTIDYSKYNYYNWAVQFDNSYSYVTGKQVHLQVYTVTIKPVYE